MNKEIDENSSQKDWPTTASCGLCRENVITLVTAFDYQSLWETSRDGQKLHKQVKSS